MDDKKQFVSTLKFLGASLVIVSMYLAYLFLLIKIDDAERYNMEMEVLLDLQHSEDAQTKQIYDRRVYKDYIRQLEQP